MTLDGQAIIMESYRNHSPAEAKELEQKIPSGSFFNSHPPQKQQAPFFSSSPKHSRAGSGIPLQKDLSMRQNKINPIAPNTCLNRQTLASLELEDKAGPSKSPPSQPSTEPRHRRMTSTVLEDDEDEHYLESLHLSFKNDKGELDYLPLEKFLSSWNEDISEPPQDSRPYHRIKLITALKALKREIKQEIKDQRLQLLQLFKQIANKEDKKEILSIIEFLTTTAPNIKTCLDSLINSMLKLSFSYLRLKNLAIKATFNAPTFPQKLESDQTLPNYIALAEPERPQQPETSINHSLAESNNKNDPLKSDPAWGRAYKLADDALNSLYGEFNAKKSWLDPRTITRIELMPEKERLLCLIGFATHELKSLKSYWQRSCCCFYPASSRVNQLYQCLAGFKVKDICQEEVNNFKIALKEIAEYLVIDGDEILQKHLKFRNSSSNFGTLPS